MRAYVRRAWAGAIVIVDLRNTGMELSARRGLLMAARVRLFKIITAILVKIWFAVEAFAFVSTRTIIGTQLLKHAVRIFLKFICITEKKINQNLYKRIYVIKFYVNLIAINLVECIAS